MANITRITVLSSVIFVNLSGLSALAGSQSILDPYASIQAPKPQNAVANKKIVKQKNVVTHSNTTVNNVPVTRKAIPANKVSNNSQNGSFVSGMKEIGHGSMVSLKAAGNGIIQGSKISGQYIASGVRAVGGKIKRNDTNNASQTISAAPDRPGAVNPHIVASEKRQGALPGRPLDQTAPAHLPKTDVLETSDVKPGVISSTFAKMNFLHKKKAQQVNNMTASSTNRVAQ